MRKNSPRKWLHACLDLLPVILIPVFMIYSHRHEINTGSIQVQEKIAVDFNQIVPLPSSDVFNVYSSGATGDFNGTEFVINNATGRDGAYLRSDYRYSLYANHKYLVNFSYFTNNNFDWECMFSNNPQRIYYRLPYNSNYTRFQSIASITTDSDLILDFFPSNVGSVSTISINNLNVFDLTQMFGVGNEPTINQFNAIFTDDYYPRVVSDKQLIDGDLVTYNDTDIMSQFTYQLYNSVDKYFNMGNVFNLNGVYDWFNLNIFNGSAPIYIYVVWQIVLYEFVMDLLFLLYGLFMWFIDIVQHLMDKPFKSIK